MKIRRNYNLEVDQGSILVNDGVATLRTRRAAAWELDCHSKYPEIFAYAGRDVLLGAGEHTLKRGESDLPTTVTLPAFAKGWQVEATTGRYSVYIVAYKPHRRYRPAYWSEKDWTEGEA